MITVDEALDVILDQVTYSEEEKIPFLESPGRILRESIEAERDLPPFDRVMMDGIAIAYKAFKKGNRTFQIQEIQPAGAPAVTLDVPVNCVEIMTGAVLPQNADTVIRYEDLKIKNGRAKVQVDEIIKQQNVHLQGTDQKANDRLLKPGRLISSAEVGLFASLGKSKVLVSKLPACTIISTGDELVDVQEKPLDHQIRRSNVYMIQARLEKFNIRAQQMHLRDDLDEIKSRLSGLMESEDLLIISGGVSKGKYDYLPEVLADLGVRKIFHKVRQRPGKPFWFGRHPKLNTIVFALPGNPVSSFVCHLQYVEPYVAKHLGTKYNEVYGQLAETVRFKPDLDYFCPVKVKSEDSRLVCYPRPGHGSGDFANLLKADGFLHLPLGRKEYQSGEKYPLLLYRNL